MMEQNKTREKLVPFISGHQGTPGTGSRLDVIEQIKRWAQEIAIRQAMGEKHMFRNNRC